MALIHPPLACVHVSSAGEQVEYEILRQLGDALPDAYTLFHHVDWSRAESHHDSHGELDIVVLNRAGDVAVLEVKAGPLEASASGLFKQYGAQRKDVGRQANWQFQAILRRLKTEQIDVRLQHCLVLPHFRVTESSSGTIGFPRERIADAVDCLDLVGFIQQRLGAGRPDPLHERVQAFLLDRIAVQPDISALATTLTLRVNSISGGLAHWVPRISSASGVIHVQATAGSGKTQLALALLRQGCTAQQRASYVCFNRPLADQMREFAPSGAEVASFHQLCWAASERSRVQPDFEVLAQRYLEACEHAAPDLDLLVIDELQDMQAPWVHALILRVHESGRIYLLDDPEQCVYPERSPIVIDQAVTVAVHENYRSPCRVVDTINALQLTEVPITARAPILGELPTFNTYESIEQGAMSIAKATVGAVQRCLDAGYSLQDIVVLCWRGRTHSALLANDVLGPWALTKFTGDYDEAGRPIESRGELRIDTVRRFKGQSAQAVVLTEVDFDEADQMWRQLLFVGLTRARMRVEVVVSERAGRVLARQLAVE